MSWLGTWPPVKPASSEGSGTGGRWITAPVVGGLGVAVATMAASTFATLGTSALAPYLRTSLHLSTVEVGLIPGLIFLGALAASVPAGHMTDHLGAGRALTVSQLGVAGGVCVASVAPESFTFLAGIAIAGLGYGAVNPATNVLSTGLVPRRRRALFLSVKQTGVTFGGLVAGLVLPRLAQALGWRTALLAAAGVLLAGALAGRWVVHRERAGWFVGGQRTRGGPAPAQESLAVPRAGATAMFGFVMAGVQLSLAGYLTLFLVDARGFSKTVAGAALSVAFAAACVGRIGWGWLADRLFASHAMTLAVISALSAVPLAAMAAGVAGAWLWPIIAMIGLLSLGWNGVYMALITESAGPRGLGRATGRGLAAIYAGVAVVPPLLGAVKGLSHSWLAVWAVAVGAVLLASATLALVPRKLVRAGEEPPALLDAPGDVAL